MIKLSSVRFGGILLTAGAVLVTANVKADPQQVTMSLTDPSTLDQYGFTAKLGSTQVIQSDDYIGIYQFSVTASTGPVTAPSTLYSVCLAPLGNLGYGSFTYNVDTLAQASVYPYANPAAWASQSSTPNSGIENALYLWNTLSGAIDGHSGAAYQSAGAALALAMYTVLYNSTGYGTYSASGPFTVTGGLTGATLSDYTTDLGDLANYVEYSGEILAPVDDTVSSGSSGQEFEMNGSPVPDGGLTLGLLGLSLAGLAVFARSRGLGAAQWSAVKLPITR